MLNRRCDQHRFLKPPVGYDLCTGIPALVGSLVPSRGLLRDREIFANLRLKLYLGYNDVPWHNPSIVAPSLHQLATQGIVLEQNYVQPKCAPSRAALLTGRWDASADYCSDQISINIHSKVFLSCPFYVNFSSFFK